MLVHHLPSEPAYLRVKTLRRLKGLGAVALKSSVYLLPDRAACGGTATISSASFLAGITDAELRGLFDLDRTREYASVTESARTLVTGDPTAADLNRLERAMSEIRQRDHFAAPGAAEAEGALANVRQRVGARADAGPAAPGGRPQGALWVTRADVFVDRMASAWLIRRFIDAGARFRFAGPGDPPPAADEIAFDMFEGGYTHEGDRCTFETLIARFDLADPGLPPIAEIVHDIDCKDGKFERPEALGVASVLRGIAAAHPRDEDRIEAAATMFDGLLADFRRV
jgi:hypothetical protein